MSKKTIINKIDENLEKVRKLKEFFGEGFIDGLETRLERMRAEEADRIGRKDREK